MKKSIKIYFITDHITVGICVELYLIGSHEMKRDLILRYKLKLLELLLGKIYDGRYLLFKIKAQLHSKCLRFFHYPTVILGRNVNN